MSDVPPSPVTMNFTPERMTLNPASPPPVEAKGEKGEAFGDEPNDIHDQIMSMGVQLFSCSAWEGVDLLTARSPPLIRRVTTSSGDETKGKEIKSVNDTEADLMNPPNPRREKLRTRKASAGKGLFSPPQDVVQAQDQIEYDASVEKLFELSESEEETESVNPSAKRRRYGTYPRGILKPESESFPINDDDEF
jgi:hypothetical protein